MQRLLIAHSFNAYSQSLLRALEQDFQVRTCDDGADVPAAIDTFRPDILILQASMPHGTAFSILQDAAFTPKLIIVLTNVVHDQLQRRLLALGVKQVLCMPTVASTVLCLRDILDDLATKRTRLSPEYLTMLHLHILHVPPHLDGYRQLRVGLPMLCRDPRQQMSKQLYPAIAKALDSSDWRAVEHSIRKAICNAWEHRDNVVWNKYFPPGSTGKSACPSNMRFLLRLSEMIRQESQSCTGTG